MVAHVIFFISSNSFLFLHQQRSLGNYCSHTHNIYIDIIFIIIIVIAWLCELRFVIGFHMYYHINYWQLFGSCVFSFTRLFQLYSTKEFENSCPSMSPRCWVNPQQEMVLYKNLCPFVDNQRFTFKTTVNDQNHTMKPNE